MKRLGDFLTIFGLFTAITFAQNISTPVFVLKDGDASATSYSGTGKSLFVDGGSLQSVGWITFQTGGVDVSKIASAKLVLYVNELTGPGTLQVRQLLSDITMPENNVRLTALRTGETIATPQSLGTADIEKIVQIDLTASVKAGTFNGVALMSDDGLAAAFDSKEGHLKPMLLLTTIINDVAAAWLSGPDSPPPDLGKDGDYYLNTSNGDVSAKAAGVWAVVTNIAGPAGADGATGAQGPIGLPGPVGLTGPTGFVAPGTAPGNTPYWNGSAWVTTSSNLFNNGQLVGIGSLGPSLKLDIAGGNWDVVGTEGDMRIGNNNYRLIMGVAIDGGGAGDASLMQHGQPNGRNILSLGAQGHQLLFVNGNLQRVGIGSGAGIDNPNATLEIRGTLSVVDGTQGAGKVLTSDASGIASWTNLDLHHGMVLIRAGTFTMGDFDVSDDTYFDPVHPVTLSQSFWLDATEVTQGDYFSLMNANPSYFLGGDRPVEQVTWFDAVLYCNARSKQHGLDTVYSYTGMTGTPENGHSALADLAIDLSKNGFRLPTEAQWEYACRGGTTTPYYWSATFPPAASHDTAHIKNNAVCEANSDILSGGHIDFGTHKAGGKFANNFRLHDMSGNVYEWCNDLYGPYASGAVTDPTGVASGSYRVIRGGCWTDFYENLRSACRQKTRPSYRDYTIGFRVALPVRSAQPGNVPPR